MLQLLGIPCSFCPKEFVVTILGDISCDLWNGPTLFTGKNKQEFCLSPEGHYDVPELLEIL